MSYLTSVGNVPDLQKAVISLWFRVPAQSIQAAASAGPILLLTFGNPQTKKLYDSTRAQTRTDHWDTATYGESNPLFTLTPSSWGSPVANDPVSPCCIGINCDGGIATLMFNIQMAEFANVANYRFDILHQDRYIQEEVSPDFPGAISDPGSTTPGSGWIGFSDMWAHSELWDFTSLQLNAQPEFFRVKSPIGLAPDRWHHLLLSFDVSAPCSTSGPSSGKEYWNTISEGTSSYCKLWYAIDDKDYRGGRNMAPYCVDMKYDPASGWPDPGEIGDPSIYGGSGDPNGILTENAWTIATDSGGDLRVGLNLNIVVQPSVCDYSPGPITGAKMGIPASSQYVDQVFHVEMAEFQMFTGVTLDTANVSSRRAFIDDKGKSVDPTKIKGDPAKGIKDDLTMGPGEKLLGKKPDILLHGSENWKKGKNTGATGVTIDPKTKKETLIPAGQFAPTAAIKRYLPDPQLGK